MSDRKNFPLTFNYILLLKFQVYQNQSIPDLEIDSIDENEIWNYFEQDFKIKTKAKCKQCNQMVDCNTEGMQLHLQRKHTPHLANFVDVSSKRKSGIWKYFKTDLLTKKSMCNQCFQIFAPGTVLSDHLKKKHDPNRKPYSSFQYENKKYTVDSLTKNCKCKKCGEIIPPGKNSVTGEILIRTDRIIQHLGRTHNFRTKLQHCDECLKIIPGRDGTNTMKRHLITEHNLIIGKKHPLKNYDQFTLHASCFFGGIDTLVVQFHEKFYFKKSKNFV